MYVDTALLRPGFVGQVEPAIQRLCKEIRGIVAIVGYPAAALHS